jgi:hypothetical protein
VVAKERQAGNTAHPGDANVWLLFRSCWRGLAATRDVARPGDGICAFAVLVFSLSLSLHMAYDASTGNHEQIRPYVAPDCLKKKIRVFFFFVLVFFFFFFVFFFFFFFFFF